MADPVVGSLRINLLANLAEFRSGMSDATKELRKFEKNFDRVGKNLQGIGTKLSIAVTAPLALFARKSIDAARDAEELQSAFNFSFGEMADTMNDFAQTTGDVLGRSTQQLQEQAFTFNQLFKTALDPKQAAELSQQFTLLTNDLSSFFNVAEGDALQKLRAGLVGEAEPLRAFGVFLSAAAVEAKAFELGLGDANGELSEQEKILARAAIILDQTADAQGDLIRTQGSFANLQRELNAEIEELAVIVGQELIPPLTELLKFLVEGIQKFRSLDPSVQTNVIRFAALAAAIGPGLIALGSFIRLVGFATKGLAAFVVVTKTAEGRVSGLRLNLLGAAASFAALVPAANAAGKAVGNFLAQDEKFINGLVILRAQLPKALGGLGISADEARRRLARYRAEQKATAEATEETVEATDNLRDSSLSALSAQLEAAEKARVAAQRKAEAEQKQFLKDNASEIDRIKSAIDPVNTTLDEFNDLLKIASRAGLDTEKAAAALAKEFITSEEDVKLFKERLEELPPAFRKVIEEFDQNEIAEKVKDDFEDLTNFAGQVTRQFDEQFVLDETIARLDEALKAGLITLDVYKEAVADAFKEFEIARGIVDPLEEVDAILRRGIDDIALGVAGLRDMGDAAKRLGIALLDALAIQPFVSALQNLLLGGPGSGGLAGGGGLLGSLFGGFLAGGGPVIPNRAFVVGEQGPELFVPSTSGEIIPNDQGGGFGGGITVNQTIVANDPNAFRASRRQQARMIRRELGIA